MGFLYIMDMAFDNSGTLWAVAEEPSECLTSDLYTINPATGAGTFVTSMIGIACEMMGLMVDPATGIMYGTIYSDPSYLYQVNTSTGAITQIGTGLGIPYPHGGDILPAAPTPTPVPTMTEWGMIIFMVFAGLGSLYYLRRQRY